nr:hypothetical protein MACL_00002729 [Theileria orientalis]
MTSNIFVLFLVFLTVYDHSVVCNGENDPADAKLTRTVFNLGSFRKNNYIISKSSDEPFSYKVMPKEGTLIHIVRLSNMVVWKTPDSWSVESIIIKPYEDNAFYAILKVKDSDNVATLMHFISSNTFEHRSLVQHIHTSNIEMFADYSSIKDSFNISSELDLRYHDISEVISEDGTLRRIMIKPAVGFFSSVHDNLTVLHYEEGISVESMVLLKSSGENKLLLLNLVDSEGAASTKYLSNDGESWELKDESEYNEIYGENNFESAEKPAEVAPGEETTRYDIMTNDSFLETNTHKFTYGTIKTICNFFKKLESIVEGDLEITSEPMFHPSVYVYRGENFWDCIEIIHSNSEKDRSYRANCYYVKEEGAWTKVNQVDFFSRIKGQIESNLTRLGASEETVQMFEQFGLEDSVERTETDSLPFAVEAPPKKVVDKNPRADQAKGPMIPGEGAMGGAGGKAPPPPTGRRKRPRGGDENLPDPSLLAGDPIPDDKDAAKGDRSEDDEETSDFRAGSIIFLLIVSLMLY